MMKTLPTLFATYLSSVYANSDCDDNAESSFNNDLRSNSKSTRNPVDILASIDVSLIEQCIDNLKFGKAAGPDTMSAEHLKHAPPTLIIHVKLLFHMIVKRSFVPNGFSQGIIISLVKDKTGNLNTTDTYRGITLTPIISKLLKSVILTICDDILQTDDRQFGLLKKLVVRMLFCLCNIDI